MKKQYPILVQKRNGFEIRKLKTCGLYAVFLGNDLLMQSDNFAKCYDYCELNSEERS